MFFFLHRKHGFVPYVKKYKKTLDENTILVYYMQILLERYAYSEIVGTFILI